MRPSPVPGFWETDPDDDHEDPVMGLWRLENEVRRAAPTMTTQTHRE